MAAGIDTLIDAAYEEAPLSRSQVVLCDPTDTVERNTHKPVPPEPDEPTLIRETAPVRAGGLQRRFMQRQQARERRLTFARTLVSTGWNHEKALAAAGYNPSQRAVATAIDNLMGHPDVTSEIQRLQLILEQRADVATIDLAKEWVGIASSDIYDYFDEVPGEDGETVKLVLKPKAQITKAARRSVKAIKIRRNKRTTKDGDEVETEDIEVQLWDKHAALDSLAKIQGLYQDKRADAINNLATKIAERTEKARRKMGRTFDSGALEAPVDR